MSDFFSELVDSFDKIKKRKFKIIVEGSRMSMEAQARAKHFVNLAIQYSKSKSNYIVFIPDLGANAKIFVAKNGKQKGNVVVDNVLSMYPLAVADGGGNPITPAWYQFVGKFQKVLDQSTFASKTNEPQMPQQQNPEAAGESDPESMQQPAMSMQMPQPNIELMNAGMTFVKLAQNNQFFTLSRGLTAPVWNDPGPNGDYPEITRRIFGPDPFSLESKINNATTIVEDPMLNTSVAVPLSDSDKQTVSRIFDGFASRVRKMYDGKFNQEDAIWISERFINDKNGFWIKDPVLLPTGISLSWRYSRSDIQHGFFRHLILAYNKVYKQWASDNQFPQSYVIGDINAAFGPYIQAKNFNALRGKSAEELRIALNAISLGDKNLAAQIISNVSQQYGNQLQLAYNNVIPYQEGYAAADKTVIDLLNAIESLTKSAMGGDVVQSVLPKLALLEKTSILLRKPLGINSVATTVGLGNVADLVEYYPDPTYINDILMSNYGFDIQEANDLSKTGKLYVGLKTYLDSGDIGLSEKDLFGVTSNLMDGRDAFIQHSMRILDVDPNFSKTATAKVEKLSHLINTLLSDITVPGFKSNIIKKTNLKLLLGKLRQNSDYKELVHLSDLEGIDMDDEVYKYKVKMLFESRLINSYLKKMTKKNDDGSLSPEAANWRKYVGLLMYLTGGSMTNQLTEVRYLDEMKNYTINHNKALTEPIAQFVNGKLDLDLNTKSGFVLFDPYTRDKYIKMVIDSSSKHKFKNQIKLIMNKIYLKRIAKSPKILARESIDLENLQIVK